MARGHVDRLGTITPEQIQIGASVRAAGSTGTIVGISPSGVVTVKWPFGIDFQYRYDADSKRLRHVPWSPREAPSAVPPLARETRDAGAVPDEDGGHDSNEGGA